MNYKPERQAVFAALIIVSFLFLYVFGEAAEFKIRVKVAEANIRLKPSAESVIISEAPLGAILNSEEKVGEWYKVTLPPDKKGFVISGYIHEDSVEILE